MPFTMTVEVDGSKADGECLPMYYCVPGCVARSACSGAIDHTAGRAVDLAKAPAPQAMS